MELSTGSAADLMELQEACLQFPKLSCAFGKDCFGKSIKERESINTLLKAFKAVVQFICFRFSPLQTRNILIKAVS